MMHNRQRHVAALALACLILAGCERKAAESNKAAGEVLEGTISDAMIATDSIRSEPPLAPRTAKASDATGDKAKAKAAVGDLTKATPAPDASPSADAPPAPKPATSDPAG